MVRKSKLTNNMHRCYVCGKVNPEIHEIYFGSNRDNSIRYGMVVPLCIEHHRGTFGVHGSKGGELNRRLKIEGQKAFMKAFPNLNFEKVFGRNYL